jgi:hypothetical protein
MKARPYRIPPVTVHLGQVLDLVTQSNGKRTRHDLKGFQLLTDADAPERADGRARLYLVKAEVSDKVPNNIDRNSAIRTWKIWNKRTRPDLIGGLYDLPETIGQQIGRAVSIGYRSDKYNKPGKAIDYDHDFREGKPPLVYVDKPKDPRAIVLTGGNIRITGRGIE